MYPDAGLMCVLSRVRKICENQAGSGFHFVPNGTTDSSKTHAATPTRSVRSLRPRGSRPLSGAKPTRCIFYREWVRARNGPLVRRDGGWFPRYEFHLKPGKNGLEYLQYEDLPAK